MYIIIVCIAIAFAASVALMKFGAGGYYGINIISGTLGVVIGCGAATGALIYAVLVWHWFAADYKAKIINREYGTRYTQSEVFYASDVIDTVRQLDRKRYEVNGDLLHEN